ncbi:type II toxin-antitoxin system RelE family toxin [Streptomyces albipurpureus]|uniref:Type II toxin-antitoxin system RelE/ParE family toxin n=1 Tax=Streptomyces albipurpureus TaxID=2897419 RepID=A0ABT0UGR8_9ACTN|nr:type II toxin-antitoxin system RelE/ParE family toxin [Streptomyces sp. CWNU-1]MCM2387817.1 type II toxin-antitoxin system RelE/ParE family toxin [Streptomyces sp. CWNU-1]
MTYHITWESCARSAYQRFLKDDRDGAKALTAAINRLALNPEPAGSRSMGNAGHRRLSVGRYRCQYHVDGATIIITVMTVGRV